jgi:hypothetical protein
MEEDRLEAEEAQKRVEVALVMEEGRASAMRGWFETLRPTPAATANQVDDKKNEDGKAQNENENENENDPSNEEVSTREQDLRDDGTPKLVCSRGGGPSCGIPRRKTTDAVLTVDAAASDSLAKTRRSESGGGLTRRRRWSTSQL